MSEEEAPPSLDFALLAVATLAHRSEHLRDHLAGTRDFHPIALANVLRFDQVEVVERGGGDRDTPDFHGLEHGDRKSTRLNSSHLGISYAVFCLKKKKNER